MAIPSDDPLVIDGEGSGGYLVLENQATVGTSTSKTYFTNFRTEGGNGSGGGAALGGVFFVNEGAALNLNNVSFASNAVKGGQGGDALKTEVSEINIALLEKSTSVTSLPQQNFSSSITKVDGNYYVTDVELVGELPGVAEGQFVSLLGASDLGTVKSVNGTSLSFDEPIKVDNSAVNSFSAYTIWNEKNIDVSQVDPDLRDSFKIGMVLSGEYIPDGTTITAVNRNLQSGEVESITLSETMTYTSGYYIDDYYQQQPVTIDAIYLPSLEVSQFTAGEQSNQITLNAAGLGLLEGMELYVDDAPSGITITSIEGDTVTLSDSVANLGDSLAFDATLPVVQDN